MFYCQLNTQSCFEIGESTIELNDYAKRAKELTYQAIGIADSKLYAYPYLADACLANDIKPIYGYRVKLACLPLRNLSAALYVLNETGYRNLCKLISTKTTVIGINHISSLREGLALIIDCDDIDFYDNNFLTTISPVLLNYSKIFKDNFYLGISIYSKDDQESVKTLYDYCERCEYQTIAFPKACYLKKTDNYKTELYKRSLKKETASDISETGPYFLLSIKSLLTLYRPEDIRQTNVLASKCRFDFFQKRGALKTFENDDVMLSKMAMNGLLERLNNIAKPEYLSRLNHELNIIKQMHFSSYFLLVSDYVQYAKRNGIKVGPGRGSAAGSLVSYALKITDLDPIKFNLSFERFLNHKRSSMPDIDIDFEDERRDEVVQYLIAKYGASKVCPIITFTKLKPKSALNFIGPALSFNPSRLKNLTVSISDKATNFREALNDRYYGSMLKRLLNDPYYLDIAKKADSLLGLPSNTSQHAVGIIISEDDIYKTCPMSDGEKGIVEYEYSTMERLGFLKFDILALSNLTLVKNIENKIKRKNKELPDIIDNLDDKETYNTLNKLYLADIFQLESKGMSYTIQSVKPEKFTDLAAILALYRPGPKDYISLFARRKNGEEKIDYISDLLEPVLKDTYGIMVYQEQVIQAVQVIADFSASDADLFRRAISKKKSDLIESYKQRFLISASKKVDEKTANKIYDMIEKFAGYGFNKSHAYSYALITYSLLYYKTHYPEEFYSAAMETTSLNTEGMKNLQTELEMLNYKISIPDINYSDLSTYNFTKDKIIYLPLNSIGGSDFENLKQIYEERNKNGPYTSIYNFCLRTYHFLTSDKQKRINPLIHSGLFDSICHSRKGLIDHIYEYFGFARMGFDENKLPPINDEEDLGERLYSEKDVLGAILSIKLSDIYQKNNYRTLLVIDDSRYELDHLLSVTDGNRDYMIEISRPQKIEKNYFIAVKGDFKKKRVFPIDIIILGRKVLKHE